MIRDIVLFGDPVLRVKCEPVAEVTAEIEELAKDMVETMEHAEGVGLAAPQVAIPIQLAVVDVTDSEDPCTYLYVDGEETALEDLMPLIFINPRLELGRSRELRMEGCLSIPDLSEKVNRPADVTATSPCSMGARLPSSPMASCRRRSSTRPITSTGSSLSTASTPRRKLA